MKVGQSLSLATIGLLIVLMVGCSTTEQPAANVAPARDDTQQIKDLRAAMNKVEPFFERMGEPQSYDWLGSHNEPGQTFDEYLNSNPTKPTKERQKIYVLPLGTFTLQQKKVIDIAAGYLGVFYDLPVEKMRPRAMPSPKKDGDSRTRTVRGVANVGKQIRTGYIMDSVLKPILPKDAAALIAFTPDDLFPDSSMAYVFGQASLADRVGVWSLFRLDDNANYDTFLRRTIKIATHETGHMFSMHHCIKYECLMSGTNYLGETDRRPIDACPECMAKVCWLTGTTPAARYKKLADYCRKNGLTKEADEFDRKLKAVS